MQPTLHRQYGRLSLDTLVVLTTDFHYVTVEYFNGS